MAGRRLPADKEVSCFDADDLSDSSENGWEWLAALSQKANKPLPPLRSISGINPLFQGDISRATSRGSQSMLRSQSFNPVFKAQQAQHEQLELDANSWQLHGLVANPRTTPQEMSSLAWNHSTSSSSIIAAPAQPAEKDPWRTSNSTAGDDALPDPMARLLAGDRQDSADWVSSSSSSDDMAAPIRSLSLPTTVLEATIGREEVALARPLGRDTSLPVSIQAGFDAKLWSADQTPVSVSTLRQCYQQEQLQQRQPSLTEQNISQQPDIWAALERQPSPVFTLRQRYTQAQQQLLQQLEGQGSAMQASGVVLELTPEDVTLQEPGFATLTGSMSHQGDHLLADLSDADQLAAPGGRLRTGYQHQAPPPDHQDVVHQLADQSRPASEHQQSGLPPQYDGVSARSVARRQLNKLPTGLFSEPVASRDEGLDRGVRFGSGTAAYDPPEADWQPASLTLSRMKSSLKQQRSPQESPKGFLRRRSFRRQASSVSFAATVSTASDGSSDSGVSVSGKSKPRVASLAAPIAKTVSSVWALINSGLGVTPSPPARSAMYQPAHTQNPDLEADFPRPRPPRPPPRSGSSLWQIASQKAAASRLQVSVSKPEPAGQRSLSRFGSFWDAQRLTAKPSLAKDLEPEHLQLGIQMLMEARQKGGKLGRSGQMKQAEWSSKIETQQSLAKVMQVMSAKQMGKSVSMASTMQVDPFLYCHTLQTQSQLISCVFFSAGSHWTVLHVSNSALLG